MCCFSGPVALVANTNLFARHFFTHLRQPFVVQGQRRRSGGGAAAALPEPRLAVHNVRFRLPPAAWDALPRYHDWGFARAGRGAGVAALT